MEGLLSFLLLALLGANSLALLLSHEWRWTLAALGAQYLLAFFFVSETWPLELAAVKLVTGWIATAILGLTLLNLPEVPRESATRFPRSPVFFILVTGVVVVMVVGAAPELAMWSRQFNINQAWGGLFLIGIGVMLAGLGDSMVRNILGLLTLLAGFEIIYAGVETSILVAGLLAILNLGVTLIGSYLMQPANPEPR